MSDSKVIVLDVPTRLDIPVDRILDRAKEAGLSHVIVVGETEDGEFYFASNRADGPETLWSLEMAKLKLLRIVDGD